MVSPVASDESLLDNRYRWLETLGSSDRGWTHQVADTHHDDQVCVIRYLRWPFAHKETRDRAIALCEQEFAFLHRLKHPQIPRFQRCCSTADGLYLVQDYVPGESLATQWQAGQESSYRGSEPEIVRLLQQLLIVVGYLHTQGVIHRHLTPGNLRLNRETGQVTVVDFGGIKEALSTAWAETRPELATDTDFAADWGTLAYAPPEQVNKGIIYTYSDIYAIAAIAMTGLTGRTIDQLRDPQTYVWDWTAHSFQSLELQNVLMRMLAAKPGERPQNVSGVLHTLRRIPPETWTSVPAVSPPSRPRFQPPATPEVAIAHNLLRSGLVLAFVFCAGGFGWLVGQAWVERHPPEPIAAPDLELSPRVVVSNAEREPIALDFPMVDEEPEPDVRLSATERQRRLALREQRRELGIDYEFFQGLVQQQYWQTYPEQQGTVPGNSPADAPLREAWDAIAQRLLNQLSSLPDQVRRRLGHTEAVEDNLPTAWQTELTELNLTPQTLDLLAQATFEVYFPGQTPDHAHLQQIWSAIALEQLKHLQQPGAIERLLPELGGEQTVRTDTLEPWAAQIYTLELQQEQLFVANLVSDHPSAIAIQAPKGAVLLAPGQDRLWSGITKERGRYTIVILGLSPNPVNYQLFLTLEAAE